MGYVVCFDRNVKADASEDRGTHNSVLYFSFTSFVEAHFLTSEIIFQFSGVLYCVAVYCQVY